MGIDVAESNAIPVIACGCQQGVWCIYWECNIHWSKVEWAQYIVYIKLPTEMVPREATLQPRFPFRFPFTSLSFAWHIFTYSSRHDDPYSTRFNCHRHINILIESRENHLPNLLLSVCILYIALVAYTHVHSTTFISHRTFEHDSADSWRTSGIRLYYKLTYSVTWAKVGCIMYTHACINIYLYLRHWGFPGWLNWYFVVQSCIGTLVQWTYYVLHI